MRIVVQRVRRGRVSVGDETLAEIEGGLVILIGVGQDDTRAEAEWLAEKCAGLRVFEDQEGKTNLSIVDIGGRAIVVSQFTLYADTRKGRRPSFIRAGLPESAEPLVEHFARCLESSGVPTQTGRFGAHMQVEIDNDGPFTLVIEREPDAEEA
jgi:D-tyrosyl-tRNA(Tyr) deacylase